MLGPPERRVLLAEEGPVADDPYTHPLEGRPDLLAKETAEAPAEGPRIRGLHTAKGGEGWCIGCEQMCPIGPDPCIGYIEGVSSACCGHGGTCTPYVVWGLGTKELRGAEATKFFESLVAGDSDQQRDSDGM